MKIQKAVIDSIAYEAPPEAISSEDIEQQLAPLYERLRLPEGRLELMTGIKERRYWSESIRPSEAAALAGMKALEQSSIPASEIEVHIHCSVCRDMLEPASAAFSHRLMGLSESVQLFDVSNACLGFLNSFSILSAMIDSGQIKSGIVTSGEIGKPLLDKTIKTLLEGDYTRKTIKPFFANLTIGSGAVAAVVCHESLSKTNHRILGGICLTDTSANDLCKGDSGSEGGLVMQTEAEELLNAGVALAQKTWDAFSVEMDWSTETPNRFITHQVGSAHQRLLFEKLKLDPSKDFVTYPTYGNIGSASLPLTLAKAQEENLLKPGDKIALLGIGSGLNSMMMGLEW